MSKASQRLNLQLRRDEHKKQWRKAKESIANEQGIQPDELSRPDVAGELLDVFHEVQSLKNDERIQQAREIVAQDHDVEPEEVSHSCLLKVTAGAYCGYQQTSDWNLSTNGESP